MLTSDGGPTRHAARHPVVGAERVRQLLQGTWKLIAFTTSSGPDEWPPVRLVEVNSSPSLVLDTPEGPIVITGEAVSGQISSIWVRLNPDKTAALKDPPPIV